MSRDHRKLRVFALADALVPRIYKCSAHFPSEERYGLQLQLRRAAVSVACNIVEGSARRGQNEYVHFLNIAAASAAEARYLCELSARLGMLMATTSADLDAAYRDLCAQLQALIRSLSPEP